MDQKLKRFIKSIWLFPAILTLLLLGLTAFKVSGSSIGVYNNIFYGDNVKDPNLIANHPRDIRSDEWLVNTQKTIAQKNNNFARVNLNVGNGEDVSLAVDVPYKEWSAIFKPHNLAFFVLPFDNAFAFRWWFIGYLLILSCYFLVLHLLPSKRLWATLVSTTLFFNPFIQWWYLYGTLGSIYYSLFGALVLMKLMDAKDRKHTLAWGGLLTYLIVCFVLILYPPFQIPCALVISGFSLGYLYKKIGELPRKKMFEKLGFLLLAVLMAGLISFTYLSTRQNVVNILRNTDYPGVRHTLSGTHGDKNETTFGLMKTFSAPLSFALQEDKKGANYYTNYYTNQSEGASFIKLNLIFVPLILLVIYKNSVLRKKLPYHLFLGTSAVLGILAVRSFTPFFNQPFRFLLLDQVQNERLEIGFLLLCIIQIVLLGSLLNGVKDQLVSKKEALFAAVVGLAFFGNASIVMYQRFPKFVPDYYLIITILIAVAVAIYLLLNKKTYAWGLVIFLVVNVASSFAINPLYRNSSPEVLANLTKFISTNYRDQKTWAVFDNLITENVPQMAGKPSLTGVHSYPQLSLWNSLDTDSSEKIEYNRYAHTAFTVGKTSDGGRFTNPSADVLLISFDCEMAKNLPNFGYALSPLLIQDPNLNCLTLDHTLDYPNIKLYIYKYAPKPPST